MISETIGSQNDFLSMTTTFRNLLAMGSYEIRVKSRLDPFAIVTSNIEAVFDPYLENSSLETLIHILSFGEANVSNGVRLLGSSKKSSGSIPKFTKVGVDAWLKQLKIKGEARIMSRTDEHRRFILLSGNKSLLLGPSLNAIHKNEAIRIESDIEDRKFFDKSWSQARTLI